MPGIFKSRPLSARIIAVFAAVVVPTIGVLGYFFYSSQREALDNSLGQRLVSVAQTAATRFNPLILSSFVPGDEQGRSYTSYRRNLITIRDRTGLSRLYIFDRNGNSLLDTRENVPPGTPYARLEFQSHEIEQALAGGGVASFLFRGEDGVWYKSGFAPVIDADGSVVAVVGADAGASYLTHLEKLRQTVFITILLASIVVILAGILLARSVSRPVRKLVEQTRRIGHGKLDSQVEVAENTPSEIMELAHEFNRMRERLDEREENQRMMIAGVAHEIRNPLSGMALFSNLVRDSLAENSESREYIDKINIELANLKNILNQFLSYARPCPPQIKKVDLFELVEKSLALVESQLREKGAVVDNQLEKDRHFALIDQEQIGRVLLNLIQNAAAAIDYPGENGQPGNISIRCAYNTADRATLCLEVEDSGCGMDRETLDKIFIPFFTTRSDGMGLGLAIARKTIEENSGAIEVESFPGKGSIFRVHLPLAENNPR